MKPEDWVRSKGQQIEAEASNVIAEAVSAASDPIGYAVHRVGRAFIAFANWLAGWFGGHTEVGTRVVPMLRKIGMKSYDIGGAWHLLKDEPHIPLRVKVEFARVWMRIYAPSGNCTESADALKDFHDGFMFRYPETDPLRTLWVIQGHGKVPHCDAPLGGEHHNYFTFLDMADPRRSVSWLIYDPKAVVGMFSGWAHQVIRDRKVDLGGHKLPKENKAGVLSLGSKILMPGIGGIGIGVTGDHGGLAAVVPAGHEGSLLADPYLAAHIATKGAV